MAKPFGKSKRIIDPGGQDPGPPGHEGSAIGGATLALPEGVNAAKLVAVRHVQASGRRIPVFLTRNEGGSIAARCVLDNGDSPIIDGPSTEAVLEMLQDAIDGLLIARVRKEPS